MKKGIKSMTWAEYSAYLEENNFWLIKSKRLALKILRHIKNEKITQVDLAKRLGISAQQINKIVRGGDNNMTFKSICKLEKELGIELIIVPEAKAWIKFESNDASELSDTKLLSMDFSRKIDQSRNDAMEAKVYQLPNERINFNSGDDRPEVLELKEN